MNSEIIERKFTIIIVALAAFSMLSKRLERLRAAFLVGRFGFPGSFGLQVWRTRLFR